MIVKDWVSLPCHGGSTQPELSFGGGWWSVVGVGGGCKVIFTLGCVELRLGF